jgi:hypothetical protein
MKRGRFVRRSRSWTRIRNGILSPVGGEGDERQIMVITRRSKADYQLYGGSHLNQAAQELKALIEDKLTLGAGPARPSTGRCALLALPNRCSSGNAYSRG